MKKLAVLFLSVSVAACAAAPQNHISPPQAPPTAQHAASTPSTVAPYQDTNAFADMKVGVPAGMSAADISANVQSLKSQMILAMGDEYMTPSPELTQGAIQQAQIMLQRQGVQIDNPQILFIVDRAVDVQRLWAVYAPSSTGDWEVIGAVKVSTGKPYRYEHYKTPVGVMINNNVNPGYRALGTRNKYGIRGIGAKGMRVWDFGWQTTTDWKNPNGRPAIVQLEMHATDPTYLAPFLGKPISEGCIHIPAKFNVFADHNGLIDGLLNPNDPNVEWLFGKDHHQTPLAGDKVVVIDTSEPNAIPSDHDEAVQINQSWADYMSDK